MNETARNGVQRKLINDWMDMFSHDQMTDALKDLKFNNGHAAETQQQSSNIQPK